MVRKAGGLAAIMSGQPVVVKKKEPPLDVFKKMFRATGLHIGLLIICVIYIYVGALIFRALEGPYENSERRSTENKYNKLVAAFMIDAEMLRGSIKDESTLNSSLFALVDEYTENLFELFDSPVSLNYFDALFYNNGEYSELWTLDAAVLFTSTTMVPVGFGLVTPLTSAGRLFLCAYAIIGIPLALVTMSDIGKFFCDAFFRLFKENMNLFCSALLTILVLYPMAGGVVIHKVSNMTLFDSIYYCSITILTVGYGDIGPPIPVVYLILFIVIGVTLVTVSVDVVAANVIHHVHFMGRQMGRAKDVAAKMIQMAQKISINRGLGLGMAQLGAFARMGMMINVGPNGKMSTHVAPVVETPVESESPVTETTNQRKSTAYDPELDFELIDRRGTMIQYDVEYENSCFGYFDDADNEAFYS